MASITNQKIFKGNKMNSFIDRIWLANPSYWNSDRRRWEFHESKVIPYLITSVGAKIFFLVTCVFGIYIGFQDQDLLTKTHLVCLGLVLLCLILLIFADILICFDGEDTLLVCNWCYLRASWIIENGSDRAVSMFGLITTGFCLFYAAATVITGVVGVQLHADPLLVYFKYFKTEARIWEILDKITMPYIALVFISSFRTIIMTVLIIGYYRLLMLKKLLTCQPTEKSLKIYKENIVAMRLLFAFEYKALATGFTGVFIGLLLTANTVMLANAQGNPTLLGLALMLSAVFFLILQLMLTIGCSFFEISSRVIALWKSKIYVNGSSLNRSRGKHLRKLVNSLEILRVPVGSIGIIDKDIKVNYLEKLLGYIVDSIIINPAF